MLTLALRINYHKARNEYSWRVRSRANVRCAFPGNGAEEIAAIERRAFKGSR